MKIYRFINRVPGGLMVVPLFIGMVLNTFFPTLLQIGGFTQALTGVGYPTILGMYLFTVGTKMTMRAAPRMLLRGVGPPDRQGRHGDALRAGGGERLRRQRPRPEHAGRDGGHERHQRRHVPGADRRDGRQGGFRHLRRAEHRDRPVPDDADLRGHRAGRDSVADDGLGDRADRGRRHPRQPRRRPQGVLRLARADHRAVHGVHARADDQPEVGGHGRICRASCSA